MNNYIYDNTFKGLLSVIFELFRSKTCPDKIISKRKFQPMLMTNDHHIETNEIHAARVLNGIKRSAAGAEVEILKVFLSETPELEWLIFNYIQLLVKEGQSVRGNYADPYVLKVMQIVKQVNREVHRMHAFVRFQKMTDDIYFASIAPGFNVLPLIGDHFRQRYADQAWLIYDMERKFGLYYNLKEMTEITLGEVPADFLTGKGGTVFHEQEKQYCTLWKNYFQAVNIPERKNIKLHLQHLPKRYWKYLPEKNN